MTPARRRSGWAIGCTVVAGLALAWVVWEFLDGYGVLLTVPRSRDSRLTGTWVTSDSYPRRMVIDSNGTGTEDDLNGYHPRPFIWGTKSGQYWAKNFSQDAWVLINPRYTLSPDGGTLTLTPLESGWTSRVYRRLKPGEHPPVQTSGP